MKNIFYTALIFTLVTCSLTNSNAQCFDDGHSPFQDQGWLSCNTSIGPIPERGNTHWLLYDFGHVYAIDSLYFWNHNVWGETGLGVKDILIDYSTDQENWTTIGPITVEKAPGSWKYTGSQGPALDNIQAQYVLVTVVSTWRESAACAGLAEIRFGLGQTVNTEELETAVEWTIAPNPALEQITIQLPESVDIQKATILNAVGQEIKEIPIANRTEVSVNLDGIREGVYFVTLSSETQVWTKSFVKIK